ncbi:HalOD1 output domain-containing protein [Natrinema salinisoli]|uniref:HalOD1 output domain-containing protein n=1 Tax=Natrinema salinisoli TaxID=2878535 RepID=UPI001CF0B41C|nr:HalOD1 output domain-containing protein [Natrinema salinisoli]
MKSIEQTAVSVSADDQLSMAVIDLVARATDTDPLELDPLYDAIDPDLLDSLPDSDGFSSLEFSYHGYTISVAAVDDEITVALEGRRISADDSSGDLIGGESST